MDEPLEQIGFAPEPGRIVVPRKHGQVLIDPPMPTMASAAAGMPNKVEVRGFAGLAHAVREEFVAAAAEHAAAIGETLAPRPSTAGRWILTGHQVEFYHAGVWAKVIAADELARRIKGQAFDLLVDHDVVDELGFDVPARDGEIWRRRPVTWGEGGHTPADGLQAPTREVFENWDAALGRHPMTHRDAIGHVLADLLPRSETPADYVTWMSRARRRLEQALGLNVLHVPTSRMCRGLAWHAFVLAWVRHADRWTKVYNHHLAAYRARMGIHSAQHPMPELQRTGDLCELPFWVYRIGETRERMVLRHDGAKMLLQAGPHAVDLTAAVAGGPEAFRHALTGAQFVVRPRALTLTMFVRLFLADVFIHGIGGALYDQITDGILQELWGVRPAYGCVSAAWLLPLGQTLDAEAVGTIRHRRHHLQHNPQQAIDPFTAQRPYVADLIRDRQNLVESLAQSLTENRRHGKPDRHAMFRRLHTINASLHAQAPRILARLDEELQQARRAADENKVLLWREWYFPLHGLTSLQALIQSVRT